MDKNYKVGIDAFGKQYECFSLEEYKNMFLDIGIELTDEQMQEIMKCGCDPKVLIRAVLELKKT